MILVKIKTTYMEKKRREAETIEESFVDFPLHGRRQLAEAETETKTETEIETKTNVAKSLLIKAEQLFVISLRTIQTLKKHLYCQHLPLGFTFNIPEKKGLKKKK